MGYKSSLNNKYTDPNFYLSQNSFNTGNSNQNQNKQLADYYQTKFGLDISQFKSFQQQNSSSSFDNLIPNYSQQFQDNTQAGAQDISLKTGLILSGSSDIADNTIGQDMVKNSISSKNPFQDLDFSKLFTSSPLSSNKESKPEDTDLGEDTSSSIGEVDTEIPLNAKNYNTNSAYTSLGAYGDAAVKAGEAIGQAIGGKYGNALSDTAKGVQTTINAAKNLKALSSLEKGTKGLKNAKASNIAAMAGAAADIGRNFLEEKTEYSGEKGDLTQTLDNVYDGISDALMSIPGWGMLAGGIMKGGALLGQGLNNLGGGTDGMTTTDAILGSSFLQLTPFGMINGFGGSTTDTITKDNDAFAQVGSSYSGSNQLVDSAVSKSGKKYGLFSKGAFNKAQDEIAESKRQQSIITNIADTARDRFNIQNAMSSINGNRRMFAMSGGYDQSAVRVGKEGMTIAKRVVSKYNIQKKQRNRLPKNEHIPEIILDVEEFKEGGILTYIQEIQLSSDIPEIILDVDNTSLEKLKEGGKFNVIPEGALHARLHHMENDENITKKGIPVVSEKENGELEQHAEIEKEEIILRLSLTKRLEELAKEDTDEAALEAGKILVEEILYNTIDNTKTLL